MRFKVKEKIKKVKVVFEGIKNDMLSEGKGVVEEGSLG